jgi:pimeloyl-ACP methyl ester carboxylesterase
LVTIHIYQTSGAPKMPEIIANGITTYYESTGAGRPIVFIHGGLVSHKMWSPQVDNFSKKYTVVTYDLRGHGRTGGSALKKYTFELLADDLKALIDALGLKKPIICGLSLGGMVAQAFAVRHPELLDALILSDTAASSALTPFEKLQAYTLGWSLLPSMRIMGVKNFVSYAFWMAKLTRGEKWLGLNEEVREYVRAEMLSLDKEEMIKIYRLILDFRLQDLASIEVPVLVTNGEFESRSVFSHTELMKSLIKDCTTAVIPGAGHTSSLENPAAFNEALEEFLADAPKGLW